MPLSKRGESALFLMSTRVPSFNVCVKVLLAIVHAPLAAFRSVEDPVFCGAEQNNRDHQDHRKKEPGQR